MTILNDENHNNRINAYKEWYDNNNDNNKNSNNIHWKKYLKKNKFDYIHKPAAIIQLIVRFQIYLMYSVLLWSIFTFD